MKVTLVAGARPNFMKIAPIIEAIRHMQVQGRDIHYRLVHTGQHYDKNMSESFFTELGIPEPHINLECGGGTQAEQAANIMLRFEKDLVQHPANVVLVVGDVTSTLACSITAKKLGVDVAHVEAGIRSGDRTMPEEINRIVTDSISDLFFTTSRLAGENLLKTGIAEEKIHFVGNTMIDTLLKHLPRLQPPAFWNTLNLAPQRYFVLTLHRPANVDDKKHLYALLSEISRSAKGLPVLFPVHPRTASQLEKNALSFANILFVPPLSYLHFNYLVKHAKGVITDSGGITEETTVMGIPCITLRKSTERPETVSEGTNELIGTDPASLSPYMEKILAGNWKKGRIPEKWDGQAAPRIVSILLSTYASY